MAVSFVTYEISADANLGGPLTGSYTVAAAGGPGAGVSMGQVVAAFPFAGSFVFRVKRPHPTLGYVWAHEEDAAAVVGTVPAVGTTAADEPIALRVWSREAVAAAEQAAVAEQAAILGSDPVAMARLYAAHLASLNQAPVTSDDLTYWAAQAPAGKPAGSEGDSDAVQEAAARVSNALSALANSSASAALKTTGAAAASRFGKLMATAASAAKAAKQAATRATAAYFGPMAPPSETALVNLQSLQVDLRTPFKPEFGPHEELLEQLWQPMFTDEPFIRVSPQWRVLGFQQNDPGTDFRGGGVLGLKCLVYMATHYPDTLREFVREQAPRTPSNYPVAISGINITTVLAAVLYLPEDRIATVEQPYWEAFFELYCLTFRVYNHEWVTRKAQYQDFNIVIEAVKQSVQTLLSEGPRNLAQLRDLALRSGVLPSEA